MATPIEAGPAANTPYGSSGDCLILDFSKVMLGSTAVLAKTPSRPVGASTEPSAARTSLRRRGLNYHFGDGRNELRMEDDDRALLTV